MNTRAVEHRFCRGPEVPEAIVAAVPASRVISKDALCPLVGTPLLLIVLVMLGQTSGSAP